MLSLYQRLKGWQHRPAAFEHTSVREPSSDSSGRLARLREGLAHSPLAWTDRGGRQPDYRECFAGSSFANFIAEPSGKVSVCNPRFGELCGVASDGHDAPIRLDSLCKPAQSWRDLVQELERGSAPVLRKLTLKREAREQEVVAHLWLERGAEGRASRIHGSILDARLLGELDALLGVRAELESTTKLAGELAHDFNNLLTVILSISELMLVSGELSANLERRGRALVSASQRAASLATQLLGLSRNRSNAVAPVATHQFVHDTVTLVRKLLPEVQMRTHIALDTGTVRADSAQLSQVVLNLAISVRDVLGPHDALGVSSQRVHLSSGWVDHLPAGEYVQLAVGAASDLESALAEGPESTLSRASCDAGRTSGLGLTSAHSIVRRFGGHLALGRGHGHAPFFTLYLPIAELPQELAQSEATYTRTKTILVAEDEELVRQLACALLRELGYHVLEAADGVGALALAKRQSGPIDLLLTDVTMPLMGGVELAREMRKLFPGLSVLYMSGHSEDTLLRQGLPKRDAYLLAKPFSRSALTQAVKRMLQQGELARQLLP